MKISKQELEQIIAEAISESSEIDEGLWDKVKALANSDVNWENAKYLASKMGTLGDKMPGGDKRKAAAAEKMQAIMDKEGNKYIKDLDAELKQNFENFPNGRSHEEFVEGAAVIFAVYETIAKRAKEDKEFCPIAEPIVADLLNYVRYLMDHKLADAYKHFKENQEQDGEILSEEEEGTFGGRAGSSKTMKGLKSNMAPAILALGGATAALGSVLLQQPWFIKLITGGGASAGSKAKQVLDVAPGEGPTQMLGRIIHGNAGHYGPKVPLGNMLSDMSAAGINPADLSKLGANPSTFLSTWNSLVSAPGAAGQSMAQVFGAAPKGGLLWHPTLKGAGLKIGKTIAGGAGAAAAQTAGFAAIAQGLLGPLAIGLFGSAGAVMAIRKKGLHSSRAQVFQTILDKMEEIKCEDGPGPQDPEDPCKDKPGTKWNPETKECEEEEEKPDCNPDTQMVDPDTGECVDIPKCPDGTVYDEKSGKCRRVKHTAEPQRLKITIYSKIIGKPGRPSVEKIVREFGAANGYKIDDDNLEDTLGKIEQWAQWTSARAYGVNRNAKAYPVDPKQLLSINEGKFLNELSPAPEPEDQEGSTPEPETDQGQFTPRSKYDVRDGKILIYVKKNGKGKIRRSLRNFLFTNIFTSQGQDTPFDRPLDRRDAKALAIAIADFVYKELEEQGGEVVQQQQQESQQINESLTIDRWKVLSGIK